MTEKDITKIAELTAKIIIDHLEAKQDEWNQDFQISMEDKLEEIVAKYWYDTEYQHIDKQDHKKATESRERFRKWLEDNIDDFLKQ